MLQIYTKRLKKTNFSLYLYPRKSEFTYLLMCEPIVSIIRKSVNFFLYGSNFCIFTALGLMPRVSPCSLRTKDSLCCFRKLSFLTVSQLYIAFRWRNVSVLMPMLSCLNAVLSTQFWPTAKQGINNRTINPIDFFGTIIQIPIYLLDVVCLSHPHVGNVVE